MNRLCILVSCLFMLQCVTDNNPNTGLEGKLGEFKVKLTLVQEGDKIEGELQYLDSKKTINVSGVLQTETLILYEFDSNNKIAGILEGKFNSNSYEGYWYSPDKKQKVIFSFGKTEVNSENLIKVEPQFVELKPKALITHFFKPYKFLSNKSALYKNKEGDETGVTFDDIEYLKTDGKKLALVFFSNGTADQLTEEGLNPDCHLCSGFLSIAKLEQVGDKWKVLSFVQDWSGGGAAWGGTSLPDLVKVGDVYFLRNEHGFGNQGYFEYGTSYYEIEKYERVLSCGGADNLASEADEDKRFSYESKIKLNEDDGVVKATVTYTGTEFVEEKNKLVDVSRKETYYYDKAKAKFIKEE